MLSVLTDTMDAEALTEFSFKGKHVPKLNAFGNYREKCLEQNDSPFMSPIDSPSMSPRWNYLT